MSKVYVGSARINEKGEARGGKSGDQTKKEVVDQPWYLHSLGWILIRVKNQALAPFIALCMRWAIDNNLIGYDQNNRDSAYKEAEKVGFDLRKVVVACTTDCSALVRLCLASAGIKIPASPRFSTSTMVRILKETGLFDIITDPLYTARPDYLKEGDILVTKSTGHTVVVLNDGDLSGGAKPQYGPINIDKVPVLHFGSSGDDVAYLQSLLAKKGHDLPRSIDRDHAYGYDGDWGEETEREFRDFQRESKDLDGNPLKVDGDCGPKSWGALLGVRCK